MDHSASTSSSRTNNRDEQLQPNYPSPGLRKSPSSEALLRWNTAESYAGPSDGESSPRPDVAALATHSTVAAPPNSVASGTSPSSTPNRINVSLRRRKSAGGSSVTGTKEDNGMQSLDAAAKTEKRSNVGERLRMLSRKLRPQKTGFSSPKVSTTEVVQNSDDNRRLNAIPTASTIELHPSTQAQGETLEQGTAESAASSNGKRRETVHQRPDGTGLQPPLIPPPMWSYPHWRTVTSVESTSTTGSARLSEKPNAHSSTSLGNVTPEPITLAARIQALIRALPSPFTPSNLTTSVIRTYTSVASNDPTPIPLSSHAQDPSSPAIAHSPNLPTPSSPIQLTSSPFPTSPLPLSPLIFPPSPLPSDSASIYGAYPIPISLDVERDASGRPIPPPYASPLPPQERMLLEELLSSPAVMNGELPSSLEDELSSSREDETRPTANTGPSEQHAMEAKGKETACYANIDVPKASARTTRSIWSVLESMGSNFTLGRSDQPASSPSSPGPAPASPLLATSSGTTNVDAQTSTSEMDESMFSDTGSSVMIYSPLVPSGAQDLPELAEVVPVDTLTHSYSSHPNENTSLGASAPVSALGNVGTAAAPSSPNGPGHTNAPDESAASWIPSAVRQWSFVQAISSWSGSSASDGPPQTAYPPSRPGGDMGAAPTQAVRKAWVPSTTKISVQAMWWGYRLYLPPPIMAILSDRTLEASKRAALITTALTWFFSNLPVTALPPPLQPAALLLQRIAPFLGYIGAFISWSWGVIEGYNVGYGVTLTATWLLPVALIPGTWHKDEFPTSPSALGQPVPLPRIPQIPHSPAPSSFTDSGLSLHAPVGNFSGMIQTRSGLVPARVTEFLPLPTPVATATATASNAPNSPAPSSSSSLSTPIAAAATPLPLSPASSQSIATSLDTPRVSGRATLPPSPVSQSTPTPLPYIPMPPSPVSSSMSSYVHSPRHLDQIPFTPQSMTTSIPSALPSPISTPSSRYQTPLLSSPAPTDSSQYHTALSSSSTPTPSRYHTPLPTSPTATSSSLYQTPLSSPPRAPSSPKLPSSPRSVISSSSATPTHQSTPLPALPPSKATSQRSQATRASNKHLPTPSSTLPSQAFESGSRSRPHPSSRVTTPVPAVSPIPVAAGSHSRRGSARRSTRTPDYSAAQTPPTPPIETDAIPYPIPVGSPLEQHLLSGPLMSPVPLPDVDLPPSAPDTNAAGGSAAPETSQSSSSSAPVPLYAYPDKEERARERDRDKARIRERARAIIFRRTNSDAPTDSRKSKA